MSRKMVLGILVVGWAAMDLLFHESLKPLIGQSISAGTALLTHWNMNK